MSLIGNNNQHLLKFHVPANPIAFFFLIIHNDSSNNNNNYKTNSFNMNLCGAKHETALKILIE